MIVALLVGDRSNDGHGYTKRFIYEVEGVSNQKDIDEAYLKGCLELGLNLHSHNDGIGVRYEDNVLSYEDYTKLKKIGYVVSGIEKGEEIYLDPEDIAEIYMLMAASVLHFTFEVVEIPNINSKMIGYGTFSL